MKELKNVLIRIGGKEMSGSHSRIGGKGKLPSKKEMLKDIKAMRADMDNLMARNMELKILDETNKRAIDKNVATIDKFNKFLNTFSLINQQWEKWSNEN